MRMFVAMVMASVMSVAQAGTTVAVDSLSADGLVLREVRCELTTGGMFASMLVVTELAARDADLDACAPDGAAVTMSWRWADGATHDVQVTQTTAPGASACMVAAMSSVGSRQEGTCRATLLVGNSVLAEEAYAAMKISESPAE